MIYLEPVARRGSLHSLHLCLSCCYSTSKTVEYLENRSQQDSSCQTSSFNLQPRYLCTFLAAMGGFTERGLSSFVLLYYCFRVNATNKSFLSEDWIIGKTSYREAFPIKMFFFSCIGAILTLYDTEQRVQVAHTYKTTSDVPHHWEI